MPGCETGRVNRLEVWSYKTGIGWRTSAFFLYERAADLSDAQDELINPMEAGHEFVRSNIYL